MSTPKPIEQCFKDQQKLWPGFTVTCKCGSLDITLDNSLGYSPTSGSWGSIDFECNSCGYSTEIVSS